MGGANHCSVYFILSFFLYPHYITVAQVTTLSVGQVWKLSQGSPRYPWPGVHRVQHIPTFEKH